jgi:hypothetical protein
VLRATNRIVSALLALSVVAAGALTAAEVVVARTGWPDDGPLVVPYDDWLATLRERTWDDVWVLLVCIGITLIGLLLILAAAAGGERRIPLHSGRSDIQMSISPASLARALTHHVSSIDGISDPRAAIGRRKAVLHAKARLGDPAALQSAVREQAQQRLDALPLEQPPQLTVRVDDARRYG